jgi:hypothetical protein
MEARYVDVDLACCVRRDNGLISPLPAVFVMDGRSLESTVGPRIGVTLQDMKTRHLIQCRNLLDRKQGEQLVCPLPAVF